MLQLLYIVRGNDLEKKSTGKFKVQTSLGSVAQWPVSRVLVFGVGVNKQWIVPTSACLVLDTLLPLLVLQILPQVGKASPNNHYNDTDQDDAQDDSNYDWPDQHLGTTLIGVVPESGNGTLVQVDDHIDFWLIPCQ